MKLHPKLVQVTENIIERSKPTRNNYIEKIDRSLKGTDNPLKP